MTDILTLRGDAQGVPTSMKDGEVYLDEPNQLAHFVTEAGMASLPLGVQGIPAPTGVASETLIQTSQGLAYVALSLGGGARSFDDQPWRVPGLTPISIGTVTIASTLSAEFDLAQPATLAGFRVTMTNGGQITFGVRNAAGSVIASTSANVVGAAPVIGTCSVLLQPGRYTIYVNVPGATTIHSIKGSVGMGPVQDYPVSLNLTAA